MSHVNKYYTKSTVTAASLALCLTRLHHPALQASPAPAKQNPHIFTFLCYSFCCWFPHPQFFSRLNFYPAKAAQKTFTQNLCVLSVLDLTGNNEEGAAEVTATKTSPQTNQDQIQPEDNEDRETCNLQAQSFVKKTLPISQPRSSPQIRPSRITLILFRPKFAISLFGRFKNYIPKLLSKQAGSGQDASGLQLSKP